MIPILLAALLQGASSQASVDPVPQLDPVKYRGILLAGAKVEAGWKTGVSLVEYQSAVREFAAQRLLLTADDPRLGLILDQTEMLLTAGAKIWRARIFEDLRSEAAASSRAVGTLLVEWGDELKFRAAIDDGVSLIRAFRQIINGSADEGFRLAEETLAGVQARLQGESPEAIAREQKAAEDAAKASLAPLSPEELRAFSVRLKDTDSAVLIAALGNELARRDPKGMKPLAPLVMALLERAEGPVARLALFDALKNMASEARDVLPQLKAFVGRTKSLYGMGVVAAIESGEASK